jgi:ABC-type uncharacterized transport system permease subunit
VVINCEQNFKEEAYLVIADYAWNVFNRRSKKFSMTYMTWGQHIHRALSSNNISSVNVYLEEVALASNQFFGCDEDEIMVYVMEFFLYRKFAETYDIIRLYNEIYGGYVCQKKLKWTKTKRN